MIAELKEPLRQGRYNTSLALTGNTGTDQKTIQIGIDDFWASEILITGKDADGDDILENVTSDVFKINITNEQGEGYTKEPIPLRALKGLVNSPRFKGWVFRSQTKLTIEASTDVFPSSTVNTYPVRIYINFLGYRLKKGM